MERQNECRIGAGGATATVTSNRCFAICQHIAKRVRGIAMRGAGKALYNKLCVFLCIVLLLTGCAATPSCSIESFGPLAATMKVLDGLFFQYAGDYYCISGTETGEGAASQAFVYHIDNDQLICTKTLPDCTSLTAFCDTEEAVYFATISSVTNGCKLYAYYKDAEAIEMCANIEATGSYGLAWDGRSALYIATSNPSSVYVYDMVTGGLSEVCAQVTDSKYIRSISYFNEKLYLGIGTIADLIELDIETGATKSVLSEEYKSESFVYAQAVLGDVILLGMSPSCRVLRYEPASGRLTDTGLLFETGITEHLEEYAATDSAGEEVRLLGTLFTESSEHILTNAILESKVSAWRPEQEVFYTLDISGVFREINTAGEILLERDMSKGLEPSYIIPVEALAYDGTIYVPWRRFVQYQSDDGTKKTYLVSSEPQASTVTAEGIFTANYTAADVWFYPFSIFEQDPAQVDFNDADQFKIAEIENQCRPTQMAVTPDQRYLIIGTGPLYGNFGGAVSVYDLKRHTLLYTKENIVEGHQIFAVCPSHMYPNAVWLGTSSYGENTTPAHLDEPGHLLLWDIEEQKILMDIIPDQDSLRVVSIVETEKGVFTISTSASVIRMDAATGKILYTNSQDGVKELLLSTDGRLLGLTDTTLVEVSPTEPQTKILAKAGEDHFLTHLMQDPITGALYCFDQTSLIKFNF